METSKNKFELKSPGRSPSRNSDYEQQDELKNVQIAAVWNEIEANIALYKKDSQFNYKKMLDEQIKHKQMLGKQGTMTQMEKTMNRNDLSGFKASQ